MRKQSWNLALVASTVLIALGARADLPAYTLIQIENDDFRDHSFAQAEKLLGVMDGDLVAYQCDGKREFEILPELLHASADGNSLKIEASDGAVGIYRDGELRNGNKKDAFMKVVLKTLAKLETLPTGKILLERLEHSPYALTIRHGTPHFWPDDDKRSGPASGMMMAQSIQLLNTLRWPEYGNQFNRIGAGGEINFDPALKALFLEDDDVKRAAAPQTILAHEMMHAFDGIRGFLDRRTLVGDAYEFIEISEYRATYMENLIRKESGLHFRKSYSDESGGGHGSLLGEDGKPMLIPAPCLKN